MLMVKGGDHDQPQCQMQCARSSAPLLRCLVCMEAPQNHMNGGAMRDTAVEGSRLLFIIILYYITLHSIIDYYF